ncbi:MAG: molybdopterin molybdotransferase MoeA [Candidatus Microthrix sp.]|uniref:Molybdopterin molybdenumtransferase n=1 Tax=Candidatus Neomicrothrix parvicella RN1 TaxID=1229780 RepID=R4Z4Z0_9ACTN|nr:MULTISPECIES: gephyrin-like molybdotransferase Glp [Microthrix]MBK7018501.1 molybdopterin molybdotransferase MoeA [Candidatus Microthrix sp.]MBL0205914.1 molybdopterin molybdotransferase MoeA [Candidatus Microthrix sp.]CCM65994.1 putative Molybdopterin molybdenumtransferase [Candidatus Microthrix parvicella RN1]
MIPLEEARSYVLGLGTPLESVEMPVGEAAGLVLAADVVAADAVPGDDNSAMDGWGLRAADATEPGTTLRVVGAQMAGVADEALRVGPGEAVRIMTGATIPAGVDAVEMVERADVDGDSVTLHLPVPAAQFIRRAGEDAVAGQRVLPIGTLLTPAGVGVATSVGAARVTVTRRPRVGVVSTGDELVSGDRPLRSGELRDSNRPGLLAAVARLGAEPVDLGWVPDDEARISEVLLRGAESCDLVLSSGGVSMGDADLVKVILARLGEMRWMQVAIKPAKPLAAGVVGSTPVVGLPGNPVSSHVSLLLFGAPLIARLAGRRDDPIVRVGALVSGGLPGHAAGGGDEKTHFTRVQTSCDANGEWTVRSAGAQGSHQLSTMALANGLAVQPGGVEVPAGATATVLLLP